MRRRDRVLPARSGPRFDPQHGRTEIMRDAEAETHSLVLYTWVKTQILRNAYYLKAYAMLNNDSYVDGD